MQQLRASAPFIEYAATFWIFHLTGSEAQSSAEVSKHFYKTFMSASTFCWLETYLVLHPGNLPDLFIFLDALRNWVISSEENGLSPGNFNFSFIAEWCGAMEQVLQEYGQVLVLRPFEIHYFNIDFAFSKGKLAELYGQFGNVDAREKSSRFEIFDHRRRPAREVPPHRRLQCDVEVLRRGIDILVHARRNVYIWSPKVRDSTEIALFVQSAGNGKRLRHVKWQVNSNETVAKYMLYTSVYNLSRDGSLLLIIVRLSNGTDLTLIWQIEEYLDFSMGLQAAPWAQLKFQCVSNPHLCPWIYNMSIAFRSDGSVCTPAGLVDSGLKTLSPISADDIGVLLDSNRDKVLYCGNGEFLFVAKYSVRPEVIEKFTWPDMQKVVEFDLWNMVRYASGTEPDAIPGLPDKIYLESVSPSGRHFVCRHFFYHRSLVAHYILLDTLSGKIVNLERDLDHGYPLHYFFDDESKINIFSVARGELEVVNYGGLSSSALSTSRQVFPGPGRFPCFYTGQLCNEHRVAIMISESGVIRCVKFGDNAVELLNEIEMINDGSNETVKFRRFISQISARLALVECRRDIIRLQIFNIIDKGERLRYLELDTRSFTDRIITDLGSITMSPDLSTLVIGSTIYNVGSPDDQIASRPYDLMNISWEDRQCVVSSNNAFIVFFPSLPRPQLDIFCLNDDGTSWAQLQPSLPKNVADFSVQFHPSLPLMAILYKLHSELPTSGDMSKMLKNVHQYDLPILHPHQVAIIDLKTGEVKPVDVLGNPVSLLVQRSESSQAIKIVTNFPAVLLHRKGNRNGRK